jgi:hypothetical protein
MRFRIRFNRIRYNMLFYSDNLAIMRKHIPDECVDLDYLGPR